MLSIDQLVEKHGLIGNDTNESFDWCDELEYYLLGKGWSIGKSDEHNWTYLKGKLEFKVTLAGSPEVNLTRHGDINEVRGRNIANASFVEILLLNISFSIPNHNGLFALAMLAVPGIAIADMRGHREINYKGMRAFLELAKIEQDKRFAGKFGVPLLSSAQGKYLESAEGLEAVFRIASLDVRSPEPEYQAWRADLVKLLEGGGYEKILEGAEGKPGSQKNEELRYEEFKHPAREKESLVLSKLYNNEAISLIRHPYTRAILPFLVGGGTTFMAYLSTAHFGPSGAINEIVRAVCSSAAGMGVSLQANSISDCIFIKRNFAAIEALSKYQVKLAE